MILYPMQNSMTMRYPSESWLQSTWLNWEFVIKLLPAIFADFIVIQLPGF